LGQNLAAFNSTPAKSCRFEKVSVPFEKTLGNVEVFCGELSAAQEALAIHP
jgi:hypothetical protein